MAMHTSEWSSSSSRNNPIRKAMVASAYDDEGGSGDVTLAALSNQFKTFGREFEKLNKTVAAMQVGCERCKGPHLTKDCDINDRPMIEQINYAGNQFQNNSGYQRNGPPGFYNRNQNQQSYNQNQYSQPAQPQAGTVVSPGLEDMLRGYMAKEEESKALLRQENELFKQQMRNHQTSIQNLERDMGRIALHLSERPPGTLPSNTQVNPNHVPTQNQSVNANNPPVTLKKKDPQVSTYSQVNVMSSSGGVNSHSESEGLEDVKNVALDFEDGIRVCDVTPEYCEYLMTLMSGGASHSEVSEVKSMEATEFPSLKVKKDAKVKDEVHIGSSQSGAQYQPELKVYKPRVPYPQALKPKLAKEDICKSNSNNNICVNVPLVDVLAGMPNYGKFLKGLMEKKGEHEQASSAFLEAECAAIVRKNELPPKLGDPGPFIVPCQVNGSEIMSALADSGACINLMPYSLYLRLNLSDLKPTSTGIKLIDQSINKPLGIAENLVVKVGELEFPADFVVVDMKEDKVVPLILGRPFLATSGSLIDWKTGKLTLRDKGRSMSFQTKYTVKPPPTPIGSIHVVDSVKPTRNATEVGKTPKCGGGSDEKLVEKPVDKPVDEVVEKSMRKLYGRVKNAMAEKDEHVRNRLVSNLSQKEKEKLRDLCEDSKVADVWLLTAIGYKGSGEGSGILRDGTYYHPGIS